MTDSGALFSKSEVCVQNTGFQTLHYFMCLSVFGISVYLQFFQLPCQEIDDS